MISIHLHFGQLVLMLLMILIMLTMLTIKMVILWNRLIGIDQTITWEGWKHICVTYASLHVVFWRLNCYLASWALVAFISVIWILENASYTAWPLLFPLLTLCIRLEWLAALYEAILFVTNELVVLYGPCVALAIGSVSWPSTTSPSKSVRLVLYFCATCRPLIIATIFLLVIGAFLFARVSCMIFHSVLSLWARWLLVEYNIVERRT